MSNIPKEIKPIEITCKRCGLTFVWTVGEQEYLYNMLALGRVQEVYQPVRCISCRMSKKSYWENKYGSKNN